ncbi:MAG: hypothetical protein ACE5H9_09580 [Anaerolineae bacterium]
MNQDLGYSQFIHGKLVGQSRYKIVAHTPDLIERQEELEALAQEYRFWGAQPPDGKPLAVGVVPAGEQLLLVQAMAGGAGNGRPALDSRGRPFSQHRYVFIPREALAALRGRTWRLLNWVMEMGAIPLFRQFEPNLAYLPPPAFQDEIDRDAAGEVEKLQRGLSLAGSRSQPVLLSALAALINQRRVLFDAAATHDVYSEDLLEGVLLLLPAGWRGRVGIAAGALDERVCHWADLLVKTHQGPQAPLPDDLLWIKRADNKIYGRANGQTFNSSYTDLLQPVATNPASLPVLLKILDSLDAASSVGRLDDGRLAVRLIPALPDEQDRAEAWQAALAGLSPEGWAEMLPAVVDDTGLDMAWQSLKSKAAGKPATYAPLVFRLWSNFEKDALLRLLREDLGQDLALAGALLEQGLLDQLDLRLDDASYRPVLYGLCLAVLSDRARRRAGGAYPLALRLANHGPFRTPAERFALLDAALGPQTPLPEVVERFNRDLGPLLPWLPEDVFAASNLLAILRASAAEVAGLLEHVVAGGAEGLDYLPHVAHHFEMNEAQRGAVYAAALAALSPTYEDSRGLLTDLLLQSLAAHRPGPAQEAWSWRASLGPTSAWFEANLPAQVVALLDRVVAAPGWETWRRLAAALLDTPLARARFLDEVSGGHPLEPLLQDWLAVVGSDPEARAYFEAGHAWRVLQEEGPAWLREALPALLGWQAVPLSRLLQLLERTQQALRLPLETLSGVLEQIPDGQALAEPLSLDQLATLLATYLPYGKGINLAESRLWRLLRARSSALAEFLRGLQSGKASRNKMNTLVVTSPEYAPIMARWLRLSGRVDWIGGPLLHALSIGWLESGDVDQELLGLLTNPAVTASFKTADWLAVTRLCWLPGNEHLRPSGQAPALKAGEKAQLAQYAREAARSYTRPDQTRRLLEDCRRWGLDRRAQEEIIAAAPPQACNVNLLVPYLYPNGQIIDPARQRYLLALAWQLVPRDDIDLARLKAFFIEQTAQLLSGNPDPAVLAHWRDLAADQALYLKALAAAARQVAATHFNQLVQCAHRLRESGLVEESRLIEQALQTYWEVEQAKLAATGTEA